MALRFEGLETGLLPHAFLIVNALHLVLITFPDLLLTLRIY